jgi:hypothetical protein
MMRTFRLPYRPKPLAEVSNRFHLTPLIRAMTSPQDIFVLALTEKGVRLLHVFVNLPPTRIHVPDLPHDAEEVARRAPRCAIPARPTGRTPKIQSHSRLRDERIEHAVLVVRCAEIT